MDNHDFFKALGYLCNPIRQTKLDAEVPVQARGRFESRYHGLTNITARPDNHNYYILHGAADKWGVELRIYFIASSIMPQGLAGMVVQPRPATKFNSRINKNRFIWKLIQYGFLLGDSQDETRIRNKVSGQYLSDFDKGYQIP